MLAKIGLFFFTQLVFSFSKGPESLRLPADLDQRWAREEIKDGISRNFPYGGYGTGSRLRTDGKIQA